ncbi:Protoheme IX farnesyltransferase 2 [Botrimarina colliarenosi]|uniref:Protoheme IX farnesyltransferase n=1 Tax=Botrimarina colliarenosi TaxID=2528001 RepID=A0A5C6AKG1_9BACT|nr:heme o synthase [Botrimarina colliarenosi]TWT99738.1 Protoheme IX farnesyltransferase 2 [Botrimarina colliarenosi]
MNPTANALPAAAERTNLLAKVGPMSKLKIFVELTKPRIVMLELVAVLITLHIATGYGAPGSRWSASLLLAVSVGTGLVAGSANALNQWIERERDARMPRTKGRPLPSGRLSPDEALWFGAFSLAFGASLLMFFAGTTAAMVAVATWVVYVALYTPLKTKTWLNTAVGAVSGAMPLWIGWAAGGGDLLDPLALSIVATMFVWQFPHFMAIAWLCRDDYTIAGYQMSTKLDPSGRWAGLQAVIGSAVLLPVSLAPMVFGAASPVAYAVVVGLAGLVMLATSAAFLAERTNPIARRLMRASLLYVPVWLAALWFCVG